MEQDVTRHKLKVRRLLPGNDRIFLFAYTLGSFLECTQLSIQRIL